MITGSNTNVRHKGRLFHVQTEDSGRRNPHVISHVYYGGTILASQKTRYQDLLDLESESLDKDVRALIEEQHRAMLKRLKGGDFDRVIAERLGDPPRAAKPKPADSPRNDPPTAPPPTQPVFESSEKPASPAAQGEAKRAFGDGIVSQKPLDEVILDYLVEKARDRAREMPAAGRTRKKG